MNTIQPALHYAKRGFSVIPVEAKGKKPLIPWERYQTERAEPKEIKKWFTDSPAANVGIITGKISGLVVIDIDTEAAKEKLKALVGEYDLDDVPRSRTGKGWQLFFAHPETPIQNRAGVLPGLDVRGDGGYVVVPPSIHPNGKLYQWEVPIGDELPKLPKSIFTLIQSQTEKEHGYRQRFNTAAALNGVPEGERDTTLFKLASKLRNADVPQDIAEELIVEAARNCEPPFPEKIVLDKVTRAYAKYQPRGNGAKEPEFWPEFLTAREILSAPQDPQRWMWEGVLPRGGTSLNVGKPKVAKTTVAANLSLAIARGVPFLGRATQRCAVAYLSLDASLPEIAEVFTRFGLREDDQIFLHAGAAPTDAIAWLVERIKQNNVGFVVIDTLQRLFRFQNINDYSEVTNAMEPLLEAAREERVHVMFLHHARKDSQGDLDSAVGSTALRGLAYTYLHLKKLPNSERRILRSDQRGGRNFPETAIGFDRVTGWLQVQGTMEDAEIEEAEPQIMEFLRAEEGEVLEKMIRENVNLRAFIVSKALRKLFRQGDVDRVGKGRKGSPFRYSPVATLEDSIPGEGVLGGEDSGIETPKTARDIGNTEEMLFPKSREPNGNRKEQNPKTGGSGTESEDFIEWEEVL